MLFASKLDCWDFCAVINPPAAAVGHPIVASPATNLNIGVVNPAASIYQTIDPRLVQPTVNWKLLLLDVFFFFFLSWVLPYRKGYIYLIIFFFSKHIHLIIWFSSLAMDWCRVKLLMKDSIYICELILDFFWSFYIFILLKIFRPGRQLFFFLEIISINHHAFLQFDLRSMFPISILWSEFCASNPRPLSIFSSN